MKKVIEKSRFWEELKAYIVQERPNILIKDFYAWCFFILSEEAKISLYKCGIKSGQDLLTLDYYDFEQLKGIKIRVKNEIKMTLKGKQLLDSPLSTMDSYFTKKEIERINSLGFVCIKDFLSYFWNCRTTSEVIDEKIYEKIHKRISKFDKDFCKVYCSPNKKSIINQHIVQDLSKFYTSLFPEIHAHLIEEILYTFYRKINENRSYDIKEWPQDTIILRQSKIYRVFISLLILEICFTPLGLHLNEVISKVKQRITLRSHQVKKVLDHLVEIGDILYCNNLYSTRVRTVTDLLNSMTLDDREYSVLLGRCKGMTLQEVGDILNLTRERVRQIEQQILRSAVVIDEYKYEDLYSNYEISDKFMFECLNVSEFSLNLIKNIFKKGNKNLENGIIDKSLPQSIKKIIYDACSDNYFFIDDNKVPKDKGRILRYFIEKYCIEDTPVDKCAELYEAFLKNNNILDKAYTYPLGYFKNRISESKYVLWKYGSTLRYFDIEYFDIDNFLKDIEIRKYKNTELSTQLFFNNYPEVMEKWDIKDRYELHNLLKKISYKIKLPLTFLKMPNIIIGKGERKQQVINLLRQSVPISVDDFVELYSLEYGVDKAVFKSSYLDIIALYKNGDTLNTDIKKLNNSRINKVQKLLDKDIYHIDIIKEKFEKAFGLEGIDYINPFNLSLLGYTLQGNLVFLSRHTSVRNSIQNFLEKADGIKIFDLEDRLLLTTPTFYNCLTDMRASFEFVEFEEGKYISIEKLKTAGLKKEVIQSYCESVNSFIEHGCFTLKSLKKAGFSHPIFEFSIGFSEFFYTSILRGSKLFKVLRINNQYILNKGSDRGSLVSLLKDVVEKRKKISIIDFNDYMLNRFGISWDNKLKTVEAAKQAGFFYSDIMENIYVDYSVYHDEV